jgi:hypothetical protein
LFLLVQGKCHIREVANPGTYHPQTIFPAFVFGLAIKISHNHCGPRMSGQALEFADIE